MSIEECYSHVQFLYVKPQREILKWTIQVLLETLWGELTSIPLPSVYSQNQSSSPAVFPLPFAPRPLHLDTMD